MPRVNNLEKVNYQRIIDKRRRLLNPIINDLKERLDMLAKDEDTKKIKKLFKIYLDKIFDKLIKDGVNEKEAYKSAYMLLTNIEKEFNILLTHHDNDDKRYKEALKISNDIMNKTLAGMLKSLNYINSEKCKLSNPEKEIERNNIIMDALENVQTTLNKLSLDDKKLAKKLILIAQQYKDSDNNQIVEQLAKKIDDSTHTFYDDTSKLSKLPEFPDLFDNEIGGSTIFCLGSSKSGKTFAMMQIYRQFFYNKKNTINILFTMSPHAAPLKSLTKPERDGLIVCVGFKSKIIETAVKLNRIHNNKFKFAIFLDDIVDQEFDITLRKMVLVYRNSNIFTIMSAQYTNLLAKKIRGSINYILFFRFNNNESIEVAVKSYLSHFLEGNTIDEKIKSYIEKTKDRKYIYIDCLENKVEFMNALKVAP